MIGNRLTFAFAQMVSIRTADTLYSGHFRRLCSKISENRVLRVSEMPTAKGQSTTTEVTEGTELGKGPSVISVTSVVRNTG